MEVKFNEAFLNFVKEKRQLIPSKIKYDEMVATLQKLASERPKSMNRNDSYLLRKNSVRIEQQKAILYHLGERTVKETQPQRVFAQEELFGNLIKRIRTLGMEESF